MRIGQILDCFTTVISNAHTDVLLSRSPDINKIQWRQAQKITTPHVTSILGEVDYVVSILLTYSTPY